MVSLACQSTLAFIRFCPFPMRCLIHGWLVLSVVSSAEASGSHSCHVSLHSHRTLSSVHFMVMLEHPTSFQTYAVLPILSSSSTCSTSAFTGFPSMRPPSCFHSTCPPRWNTTNCSIMDATRSTSYVRCVHPTRPQTRASWCGSNGNGPTGGSASGPSLLRIPSEYSLGRGGDPPRFGGRATTCGAR